MLNAYITKRIWEDHAYMVSSLDRIFKRLRCLLEKQSRCQHFLSSLLELRWFCSLFFWNKNSLLNCNFFFSLKIWTFSCHWLHSSSSVRGSISSLWDWTLLCDTSNKRLYFPVSEREKILEDHEALLQSYTDKHLRSFSQLMETSVCQAWLYAHVSCLSK